MAITFTNVVYSAEDTLNPKPMKVPFVEKRSFADLECSVAVLYVQ
jgi:hypothetical protein